MNERDKILSAITQNKPALIAEPGLNFGDVSAAGMDLVNQFTATLESIGGTYFLVEGYQDITQAIREASDRGDRVVNTIAAAGLIDPGINNAQTALELESVHQAYIMGSVAVAENGAIWVKESQAINRLLPFICQHLVLVVDAALVVPTMHEAYQQIKIDDEGYGVFIAGPSKTADIEQALVIGAHGPRSLVVYLVIDAGSL